MEARSTQQVKYSAMEINDNVNKTMAEFTSLNKSCVEGPAGSAANVRSLYALFGGYSHNSEVFE